MARQYEILSCPFCNEYCISAIYFPSVWSQKRVITGPLPGNRSVNKSKEEWIIQSGCSKCGKSQKEVEEELKRKEKI